MFLEESKCSHHSCYQLVSFALKKSTYLVRINKSSVNGMPQNLLYSNASCVKTSCAIKINF